MYLPPAKYTETFAFACCTHHLFPARELLNTAHLADAPSTPVPIAY